MYTFIDSHGTFRLTPSDYNLYFPLTNAEGTLLSAITPRLAGDIKSDNEHFLTPPASVEDLRSNLLCRREFYLRYGHRSFRLSQPLRDTLEAGLLYHKLTKIAPGLRIEIVNFVPYDRPVEVMWLTITNTSRRAVPLEATSCIPLYGRSEKNIRDHRHVSSLLNRIQLIPHGIVMQPTMIFNEHGHRLNSTVYYCLGCEDAGAAPAGQFPTLDYFCGRGNLENPDALAGDVPCVTRAHQRFQGKEAVAAFRFRSKPLPPGGERNIILVLGIEDNADGKSRTRIGRTFAGLNTPQLVAKSLEETKRYWRTYLDRVHIDFKDSRFSNWLLWAKVQPTLRKLFGCSFLPHFDYGKGGRGWRDLWQDTLALLLTEPQKAQELLEASFRGVRIDGSNATIITKDNSFLSDRNNISRVWMDHGVWPYLSLRSCIMRSGDLTLLLKKTTYFQDHLFCRARHSDAGFHNDLILRTPDGRIYEGTVLEHVLVQLLTAFFNVGEHNIIRLENADWNDGLDMAPERGESVAFSFMYAHHLRDLCSLLERLQKHTPHLSLCRELLLLIDTLSDPLDYNDPSAKQKRLNAYCEKVRRVSGETVALATDDLIRDLTRKAEHLGAWLHDNEWLSEGFFNGYYDNRGKRLEGNVSGRTQMMLTPQVFSIMSGVADTQQIQKIWQSLKKHLYDKTLKGFRLNTDFGSPVLTLGRAFGFSYGDKENGAFFNHMAVMLAYAFYSRGFIEQGAQVLASIRSMAEAALLYPVIPEYFNGEGRGLYSYLTGSASWYVYTLVQEVLGVTFSFGEMYLAPKLTPAFIPSSSIEVTLPYQGKTVTILYAATKKRSGVYRLKKATLDGQILPLEPRGVRIASELLANTRNGSITIRLDLA